MSLIDETPPWFSETTVMFHQTALMINFSIKTKCLFLRLIFYYHLSFIIVPFDAYH